MRGSTRENQDLNPISRWHAAECDDANLVLGAHGSYDLDHTPAWPSTSSNLILGRGGYSMTIRDCLPSAVLTAGRERELSPGQALFRQGDRTAGIYEIIKGQVQMIRVDAGGREVVLYAAKPGSVFAEAALFSSTYHCDAVSKTGAVVRLFPKAKVLAALRSDPDAAEAFMALLSREIIRLRTCLEQRNIRSARERVRLPPRRAT
jgi:CRP-like cAMP-binding protein